MKDGFNRSLIGQPFSSLARIGRLEGGLLLATGLMLAFFYLIYQAFPAPAGGPRTLATWTWNACNSANDFLHGRFIPLIFIVMCWIGWRRAQHEIIKPNNLGLIAVGIGLFCFLIAVRTIQPRIAIMGLPFLTVGIVLYLFGFEVMKHFLFPACFWVFAIPVPGLSDALTGGLQILTTQSCYHAGVLLGMDLSLQGSQIYVNSQPFDIAEGCSGIRSLMALTMIAAVYGNYTQKPLWKKAVIFASALPLAIIGNFGRIFTILVLASLGFGDFARRTYHDWAGLLLFFPIALSGLYLIDYILNFKERRKKKVKKTIKRVSKSKQEEAAV